MLGVYLDRGMLVDQVDGEDEAQIVVSPNQDALQALHRTALDANLLTYNQLAIRLNLIFAIIRAQELDCRIQNRERFPAVANDPQNPRRLQDPSTLPGIDTHEQVGRKQRQHELHPLPILPDPNGFIGREKRLNLPHSKMLHNRLFILRNSEDRVPTAVARSSQASGVKGVLTAKWLTCRLQSHAMPTIQTPHLMNNQEQRLELTRRIRC
jgi:hypothetical protein